MTARGTLLVLDDDTLTCELVQAILTDEGFHVLTATTGTDALALFRKHAAEIRAVLLDLWMPGLTGREVLREIHRPARGRVDPEALLPRRVPPEGPRGGGGD